jgi:hypothetical protein
MLPAPGGTAARWGSSSRGQRDGGDVIGLLDGMIDLDGCPRELDLALHDLDPGRDCSEGRRADAGLSIRAARLKSDTFERDARRLRRSHVVAKEGVPTQIRRKPFDHPNRSARVCARPTHRHFGNRPAGRCAFTRSSML